MGGGIGIKGRTLWDRMTDIPKALATNGRGEDEPVLCKLLKHTDYATHTVHTTRMTTRGVYCLKGKDTDTPAQSKLLWSITFYDTWNGYAPLDMYYDSVNEIVKGSRKRRLSTKLLFSHQKRLKGHHIGEEAEWVR